MVQYCMDLLFELRIVGAIYLLFRFTRSNAKKKVASFCVRTCAEREWQSQITVFCIFSFSHVFMGVKLFPKTGSRESRVAFSDGHHSFSFLTWMASFGVNPKTYRTLKKPTCAQYRFVRNFSSFSVDRVDDDAFERGESIDRIVQILPFNKRERKVRPSNHLHFYWSFHRLQCVRHHTTSHIEGR